MGSSIEEAQQEVQRAFKQALEVSDSEERRPLQAVEGQLWTLLLGLGCSLIRLYLARQVERPRAQRYWYGGVQYELEKEPLSSELGVRFGKTELRRPVGRPVGRPKGARDYPVDRELGLSGGFSMLVVMTVVKLCAQMAFASARGSFRDVFEWSPSPRATLRMVDGVGEHARPFLEQAPAPEGDGPVMGILVDGKGAPSISSRERARRARPHRKSRANGTLRSERRKRRRANPRPRRKPGDKSKNAKMAAVAVIYTMRPAKQGKMEGPLNKRLYASFTSYRKLFEWIRAEAEKRGYGTPKIRKLYFAADGAKVLWDLQKEYFPDAEVCEDWFHVVEKLWKVGKVLHRNNRKQVQAWVAAQKRRLRLGQLDALLTELQTTLDATALTGPGNKRRREVLEKTLKHLRENAERMQYHRLRRQGFDIGTGIVEGAVRQLVGIRLDGPGMRWGCDRRELILHLRCILLNGQWDDFIKYLAAKEQVRLPAQPIPARPYDAKPVKEAA